MLRGELGVSQAFLTRLYIGGGCMDVSEAAVFYDCGKIYTSRTVSLAYLTVFSLQLPANPVEFCLFDYSVSTTQSVNKRRKRWELTFILLTWRIW